MPIDLRSIVRMKKAEKPSLFCWPLCIPQVCFFSATLHSPAIADLAAKICLNPTWVDLKGVDSVPETVHHGDGK